MFLADVVGTSQCVLPCPVRMVSNALGAIQGWTRHSRRFFPPCLAREDAACDVDEVLKALHLKMSFYFRWLLIDRQSGRWRYPPRAAVGEAVVYSVGKQQQKSTSSC
ncbi:hypothetical protein AOLI_G00027770 [Acnodon oligacanthus]